MMMDITRLPGNRLVAARKPDNAGVRPPSASSSGAAGDVFFGGRRPYAYPPAFNLGNRLFQLGAPGSPTRDKVAFRVSRYFMPKAADPQKDNAPYYLARLSRAKRPESPADRETYTFGDLYDDAAQLAGAFREMGLAGKPIAIADTNSPDKIVADAATLYVGGIRVPLNLLALQDEGTKTDRLLHMINGPKSAAIVVGNDPLLHKMQGFKKIVRLKNMPRVRGILARYGEGLPPRRFAPLEKLIYKKLDAQVRLDADAAVTALESKGVTPSEIDRPEIEGRIRRDLQKLVKYLPAELTVITPQAGTRLAKAKPLKPEEMALIPEPEALTGILYTSGTSGNPKGVARTHRNEVFTADSLRHVLFNKENPEKGIIRPDDVLLLGLPLFHIFGQAVLMVGMNNRNEIVLLPSLSEAVRSMDKVIKTIRDYNVTVLPSVPIFLEKLVDYAKDKPEARQALKQLRVIISGGAPLKQETHDALLALNPSAVIVAEGYGSTEAGIVTLNVSNLPGYIGKPIPGVEVKLVENREAHAMEGWSTGEGPGEILVRSPGVSPGYVRGTAPDAADTKPEDAFVGISDKGGWFHSGDQGRMARSGYRYVTRPEEMAVHQGRAVRQYKDRDGKLTGILIRDRQNLASGMLQITGRQSNFIKDSGGERRDPVELETALMQAEPLVADAMAVAYKPDRETEKSVVVAVTPDPAITEDALKAAMGKAVASGRIPGALVPKHIIVLHRDDMPEAFKNEFKREAGYKAVKDFVGKLVAAGLVELRDKTADARETTAIADPEALERFARDYRYIG